MFKENIFSLMTMQKNWRKTHTHTHTHVCHGLCLEDFFFLQPLLFSHFVQIKINKLHLKIFFQDVHVFNFFNFFKLLNIIEDTIETYNFQHFNNGVLKIYFFNHIYISHTLSKWKKRYFILYFISQDFPTHKILKKRKINQFDYKCIWILLFNPFQQQFLKEKKSFK